MQDLARKQFGRWYVLNFSRIEVYPTGHKAYHWNCRCSCGKEKEVRSNHLLSGKTNSCGCYRTEIRTRKDRPTTVRQIYTTYKHGAARYNRVFELTEEQVYNLAIQNCVYCGALPQNIAKHATNSKYNWIYNGIDRVDNSKGYTLNNVVTACRHCNIAKRTMSREEFLSWIERVYNHSISKRAYAA